MSDVMAQLAKDNGMTSKEYSKEVVLSAVKILSVGMEIGGLEKDRLTFSNENETIILEIEKVAK